MKIINIIVRSIVLIFFFVEMMTGPKLKQPPLPDNQYRQANVPPVLAVIMDVPSFSKDDLFKWNDFIQANTMLVAKNKMKNEEIIEKSYENRLKRIGLIKAKLK